MYPTRCTRRRWRLSRNVNRSVCPELVGTRTLEAPRLVRVALRGRLLHRVARLDQHALHGARARGQPLRAVQHVVDAVLAPLRVLLLHHQDRPTHVLGQSAAPLPLAVPHQRRRSLLLEPPLPGTQRLRRHTHQLAEIRGRKLASTPRVKQQQPLLARVLPRGLRAAARRVRPPIRYARPPPSICLHVVGGRTARLGPISGPPLLAHRSPFLPPNRRGWGESDTDPYFSGSARQQLVEDDRHASTPWLSRLRWHCPCRVRRNASPRHARDAPSPA